LKTQGINFLLLLIPVTGVLHAVGANQTWLFVSSALSIVPLSKLMGDVTETLSEYLGPTKGGFLNATLGNAPEIIISFFALKAGLFEMVKCSITGSIIGNLLLGLGITFLSTAKGHLTRDVYFDLTASRVHSGLLVFALFGLIIPAVFDFSTTIDTEISLEISVILIVVYVLAILTTFYPRVPHVPADDPLEIAHLEDESEGASSRWSQKTAVLVMGLVAVLLALMSDTMANSIEPVTHGLGLTPSFVGVFVLALLGNVAELTSAVRFARNDQIDLALGVLLGGSAQMAMMVAPTLVLMGALLSFEMNLLFSIYDLVAVMMTVMAVSNFLSAGNFRPRVGIVFIAIYVMLGVGFFNMPA
jgi:Ca2+:H+ antiporter